MENQILLALKNNKLLKNILFDELNLSQIKGNLLTIGEGEILFREGEASDKMYLVVSGELNLLKKKSTGKAQSLIFSENDFFGVDELIESVKRKSTAVALRDSYIIALSKLELDNLIDQNVEVLTNIYDEIRNEDNESPGFEKIETAEDLSPVDLPEQPASGFNEKILNNLPTEESIDSSESVKPEIQEDFTSAGEFFTGIESQGPDNEGVNFPDFNMPSLPEVDDPFAEDNLHNESLSPDPGTLPEINELQNKLEPENTIQNDLSNFQDNENPGDTFLSAFGDDVPPSEGFLNLETENDLNIPEPEKEPEPGESPTDDLNPYLDPFYLNLEGGNEPNPEIEKFELGNDSFEIVENNLPTDPLKFEQEGSTFYDKLDDLVDEKIENPFTDIDNSASFETKFPGEMQPEEDVDSVIELPQDESNSNITEEKVRTVNTGKDMDFDKDSTLVLFEKINKAAELVNSNIEIDEVLRNIVSVATELTDADRGTLYLVDKEKNELWSKIAMGNEFKEIKLIMGEGIAGWVAQKGELISLENVQEDQRFNTKFDKSSGYVTKSMLCFPVKNRNEDVVGVLQLINSKNGKFSKLDEEFLEALSIHAAMALQNAEHVEKMLSSERVASLGKMANFLIQDIKKPIMVSKRYAEHLKSKNLEEDVVRVVDMLLDQLNHIAELVQSTSSYSEGQIVLRSILTRLNETLDDYIQRVEQLLHSNNCQIIKAYDNDVNVKISVKQFFQCFQHIVKNACEAMPDGGTISLMTKRDKDRINIIIKDNGLGIPESLQAKIFEPFMSHGKKDSTGLGLSITKKIIEEHGGTISVKSEVGEGATFTVSLPIVYSV